MAEEADQEEVQIGETMKESFPWHCWGNFTFSLASVSRKMLDWRAAEMARYLGVTTSAVNRLAASYESRELLKYA